MKKIYALFLTSVITVSLFAGSCSTLFFSEYIEGSGNNKAIEIYNPTLAAVNTTGYRVLLFTNGSTSPSVSFYLNAVIAPGDVYVIMNSTANPTLLALADTVSGVATFTGNDAVALVHGIDTLDVIGIVGDNPGIAWQVDTFTLGTTNRTLVRKSNVFTGTKSWAFGATQWTVLDSSLNQLGAHSGPTGQSLCSASPYDTIVNFSPISGSFSGVNGSITLDLGLNVSHASSLSVDVELLSGNATWVNNYTTQTVTFAANSTHQTLPLTITNDTTGQLTHTLTFRLTNPLNGLVVGTSNIYTLTLTPFAPVADCATLFFSEYVEGKSNNKALEIYNPTSAPVNLNGYSVQVYTNGSATASNTLNLDGILNVGATYVIANTQSDSVTIKPDADTLSNSVSNFNGDDAIALVYGSALVDVIGVIGVDPGTSWSVDTGTTIDHTLIRNSNVTSGTTSWPVSTTQWTVYSFGVDSLGAHNGPLNQAPCVINGITAVESNNLVRVYPNPNNGKFVIELQNAIAAEIKLFDMTGQLVYTIKETSSNLVSIDANNLSAGIYLAEIKTGNQISRSRISVQH